MSKRSTIKDVAREADVSMMTVSRVLSGKGRISEATRERVRAIADKLGYVPDRNAGALSSRSSGFVAVLVPSIDNSNFAQMVYGASHELEKTGRQILVGATEFTTQTEERVLRELLRRRPDGVVLVGGYHSDGAHTLLRNSGIPIVETWDLPEQPLGHVVGFSNAAAYAAIVDHLVERNYKNIGFVGADSPHDTRGASRKNGFRERMQHHGLNPDRIMSLGPPPIPVEQGGEAIVAMRQRWPELDAVVFISDRTAFGAVMEARRRGWDVPGDIAVAGFGDFDMARNSHPRITTVSIDCTTIGQRAAQIVQEDIEARARGAEYSSQTVLMDFRVLAREST